MNNWYEEQRRRYEAFADATYQRLMTEAMFAAYIKLPFHDEVAWFVGYNPQKLLPSPEKMPPLTKLQHWVAAFLGTNLYISNMKDVFPKTFHYGGMIDFDKHSIAPLVSPAWHDFDVQRWNDPDATPLDDLQRMRDEMFPPRTPTFRHQVVVVHADIDTRALSRLLERPYVRGAIIDLESPGGELPSPFDVHMFKPKVEKTVDTAGGKRDKSYLKHDRTKSHKRRRK